MSSPDPNFNDDHLPEPSPDEEYSRPSSRPISAPPVPPRKRRRSASAGSLRSRKAHLSGNYNDAYRRLFNECVHEAAARFVVDESLHPEPAQVGASRWSAKEKSIFFAALEKLGRDDIPGIAKAIGSKSIQETRQLLLLMQDAPSQRNILRERNLEVTLQDIPAAIEVPFECEDRLELAGDALAWYQERFEAKQEQERYGDYWLITPEVADEIEEAIDASQASESASSPGSEDEDEQSHDSTSGTNPQTLQNIPEAKLIKPAALLVLSKHIFMNPSSTVPYPWPHWEELVSELAAEPSIYRTALRDLHALVVSVTRRLVQLAIIQATSRHRALDGVQKRGVKPVLNTRDVLTAVDLLGMRRNSRKHWRSVARRCGLRVMARRKQKPGSRWKTSAQEVPWDEVEHILDIAVPVENAFEPLSTDVETAALTSGTDDRSFNSRALRSGTPLPSARQAISVFLSEGENSDRAHHIEVEDSTSEAYDSQDDQASETSILDDASKFGRNAYDASEEEFNATEDFDKVASQAEEQQLWVLLDVTPAVHGSPKLKEDAGESKTKIPRKKQIREADDWQNWTQYRAEWEELRKPVPHSSFLANQKHVNPTRAFEAVKHHGTENTVETDRSSRSVGRRGKCRTPAHAELPIRGARAYAAMQESISMSKDRNDGDIDAGYDDAEAPMQSIEHADGINDAPYASDVPMDWDQ